MSRRKRSIPLPDDQALSGESLRIWLAGRQWPRKALKECVANAKLANICHLDGQEMGLGKSLPGKGVFKSGSRKGVSKNPFSKDDSRNGFSNQLFRNHFQKSPFQNCFWKTSFGDRSQKTPFGECFSIRAFSRAHKYYKTGYLGKGTGDFSGKVELLDFLGQI